ncbi:MAG: acyltransferase family protein [Chitinophagales bacterium]
MFMMQHNIIKPLPKRFHSLDAVRGIAALSVVLYHWQHFFYQGISPQKYDYRAQPFYSLFALFYQKGWSAVDLFFSLSGFIFYWLYAEAIKERRISGREFFVLRFSRLYPLHILTLLIVWVEQMAAKNLTGSFSVYPNNDLYHFILNIFFISNWGFNKGVSFNAPIWSVSIEVFLYIIFFLISFLGGARSIWITLSMILLSFFLHFLPYIMSLGIFCFFLGGAMFLLYEKLTRFDLKKLTILFGSITLLLWVTAIIFLKEKPLSRIPGLHEFTHLYKAIDLGSFYFAPAILFPVTILFLAIAETFRGSLGARIGFIGDISYSSYLLHFPLQLLFILILPYLHLGKEVFFSKIFFIIFFAILIGLSLLSYHKFERPMQKLIRNRLRPQSKEKIQPA